MFENPLSSKNPFLFHRRPRRTKRNTLSWIFRADERIPFFSLPPSSIFDLRPRRTKYHFPSQIFGPQDRSEDRTEDGENKACSKIGGAPSQMAKQNSSCFRLRRTRNSASIFYLLGRKNEELPIIFLPIPLRPTLTRSSQLSWSRNLDRYPLPKIGPKIKTGSLTNSNSGHVYQSKTGYVEAGRRTNPKHEYNQTKK